MPPQQAITQGVKGVAPPGGAPDLRSLGVPELRALRDHVLVRLGEINARLAAVGAPPAESVIVDRLTLGRLLGVGPDRVSVYTREGMPVVEGGRRGGTAARYDAIAALAWWRLKKQGSADAEKANKDRSQTRLNEQRHAERAGLLVSREQVIREGQGLAKVLRSSVLALPRRLVGGGLIRPDQESAVRNLCAESLTAWSAWMREDVKRANNVVVS